MRPTVTCKPWNPVKRKKVVEKTIEFILTLEETYSFLCKNKNIKPRIQVSVRNTFTKKNFSVNKALCATVTVAADESSMTVLESLKASSIIFINSKGGQTAPIYTVGTQHEWKNLQKNPKKNIISETTNKIKPYWKKFSKRKW